MVFCLGVLGMSADEFYYSTPREIDARARGLRRKMLVDAVAVGAGYSGRLDLIDRFFGVGPGEMSDDDYNELKRELGLMGEEATRDADRL